MKFKTLFDVFLIYKFMLKYLISNRVFAISKKHEINKTD